MPTISDLFDLEYGHSLELNRIERTAGPEAVNFVGRAAKNNGVTARVRRIADLEPAPAGTISVALNGQGGAGVAFLQPFPYYSGFHVMVLRPKVAMTEQESLWWATCITANRFRFGFGRQANRTLKNLELPDRASIPHWVAEASVDYGAECSLPASQFPVILRDVQEWKSFALGNLFDLRKGQRLTKADMSAGATPFVGASDLFNGVTNRVGQSPIHSGGTISVSYNGSVAEAFYQPVAFWASDDVNVLYPKGFQLTPATALFLCAVIRLEKYRFNYGRKWHLERMRESIIRLPATLDGQPDWAHMAEYVGALPYTSQIGETDKADDYTPGPRAAP